MAPYAPPRLLVREPSSGPPPDEARARVAVPRGGGVVLARDRRAEPALDLSHGVVAAHTRDGLLQTRRLGEILSRDGVGELALERRTGEGSGEEGWVSGMGRDGGAGREGGVRRTTWMAEAGRGGGGGRIFFVVHLLRGRRRVMTHTAQQCEMRRAAGRKNRGRATRRGTGPGAGRGRGGVARAGASRGASGREPSRVFARRVGMGAARASRGAVENPRTSPTKSEKGAHLEGGEDGVLVVDAVEDFGPVLPVLHGVVVVRRALLGRDEPPRAVRHLREALPQPLGLMQRPRYRVGALAVRPLDPSRRFPGLRPDDARGAAVEPREPTRSTREAPRERGRAPRRDPATERAWGRPGRRRDRGGGARRGTPPSGKSRNDGGRAKRADRRGRHRAASLAALSKASVVSRGRVRR